MSCSRRPNTQKRLLVCILLHVRVPSHRPTEVSVPTYSDADFKDSRFAFGERVRILLRHPKLGGVFGEAEGTCAAREENVEFEARDGTMRTKTLVWLKEIEGYEKPHEDLPDTTTEVEEAWFAEEALRKKEGDPLDGVSFN